MELKYCKNPLDYDTYIQFLLVCLIVSCIFMGPSKKNLNLHRPKKNHRLHTLLKQNHDNNSNSHRRRFSCFFKLVLRCTLTVIQLIALSFHNEFINLLKEDENWHNEMFSLIIYVLFAGCVFLLQWCCLHIPQESPNKAFYCLNFNNDVSIPTQDDCKHKLKKNT